MRRFFLMLSVFLCNILFAQETKFVTQFKHLEIKNGLPENDVKGVVFDDQNGYWFRTTHYIVNYNGHDFITYGKDKKLFSISNSEVLSFNIQGNYLYVFGNSGVDRINVINKKSEQLFKDTTGIGIKAGFFTKKGHLLIVFKNGDIAQLSSKKIKKLYKLPLYAFCEIIETKEDNILISNVNKEVAVLSADLSVRNHIILPEPILLNGQMQTIDSIGTIVGANKRLLKYNSKTHQLDLYKADPELGRLFLYTASQRFNVLGFNKVVQYDYETQRSIELNIFLNYNYYINKIKVDKNNVLVFCTNQGIVLYKTPYAFLSYPQPQTLNNKVENTTRRAILETPDHKILFVSYGHIDEYDPVTTTIKPFSNVKLDGYSGLFLKDKLWIGSDGTGLYSVNLQTRKLIPDSSYKLTFGRKAMHITVLNKLDDNTLLLGESGASNNLTIYHIDKKYYEEFVVGGWKEKKIKDKVTAIIDHSGSKWICTNGGLLEIRNQNQVNTYLDKKILGTNVVNYVLPLGDSVLWIATDMGIIKYDRKRARVTNRITEKGGLSGNLCVSILPDKYNTIWVPTFTGLSRIDLRSLQIWNYYMQEGFTDNEYNYASYLRASNGDLYLGGLNGFVRIRPTLPERKLARQLSIRLDNVILYKKENDELVDISDLKALKMHKAEDRLSITFTLSEHLSPEYVRYYYKIEGLQNEWVSLERQNKLDLAYLPSGKFKLMIKAIFLENQHEQYQLSVPLHVVNYWYETKWFYFILSFVLISSIIGFFYNRYSASKEVTKIRTGLANDIHDEIGTMLTKAIMRLELLAKNQTVKREELSGVQDQLRNTVLSFRNVLWSLNTDNIKTIDFVGRLNLLLEEIFEDTRFEFIITNLSPNIYFKKSIFVKRNILLIVKELANNALKHSNGNLFEVVIRSEGGKWNILIVDNGTNENNEIQFTGVGLSSIQKRIEAMNGSVQIIKQQKGFFVYLYL